MAGKSSGHTLVPSVIAGLLGSLLLVICYKVTDEHGFWHSFTHEIGFALIVAVLIYLAFEFYRSSHIEEEWNRRIEQVSKTVFQSVFKKNLPEAYIKEANRQTIDVTFYRTKLHQSYTLSDCTYTRNATVFNFVKVDVVADFKIKNITDSKATLPIGIGLPNPLIDEMKKHCKVSSVEVIKFNNKKLVDLIRAEEKFQNTIANDDSLLVNFEVADEDLEPGEEIQVIIKYCMAKEDEDSELFQTRYPSENMTLLVFDKGPTKRIVKARSIGQSQLDVAAENPETGTYSYELRNYLLPRHGVVVWWKKLSH